MIAFVIQQYTAALFKEIEEAAIAEYEKTDYFKPLGKTMWIRAYRAGALEFGARMKKMMEDAPLFEAWTKEHYKPYTRGLIGQYYHKDQEDKPDDQKKIYAPYDLYLIFLKRS